MVTIRLMRMLRPRCGVMTTVAAVMVVEVVNAADANERAELIQQDVHVSGNEHLAFEDNV